MDPEQWKDFVTRFTEGPWAQFVAFLPDLVGAVVIMAVGYLLARVIRRVIAGVLRGVGFDTLAARLGVSRFVSSVGGAGTTASYVVGYIAYGLVLLATVLLASETLGLVSLTAALRSILVYLPSFTVAAAIAVTGFVLAAATRNLIRGAAEAADIDNADTLGTVGYVVVVAVSLSLAAGQLSIEMLLVNRIIQIAFLGGVIALVMAFSSGTRDVSRHLVAGIYLRDMHTPGTTITAGDDTGLIEEIGPISTRLRTADGTVVFIPNAHLVDSVVVQRRTEA